MDVFLKHSPTLPHPLILENIPLKKFCTFGIGGPARYLTETRSIKEMQAAIKWASDNKITYFILGKGSNCLFDDLGYHGLIIVNKIEFINEILPGTFHVGAGYSFALLGVQTARKGWSGLEFASGIPASLGGAICMNAGANGNETSRFLQSVDFINEECKLEIIPKNSLTFSYRRSPFLNRKGAIAAATFSLIEKAEARKEQIDLINKRKKTQPYGSLSAGCIFLNPPNNHAGALIERCGLKGLNCGEAEVSDIHANFLINKGKATCKEMLDLISLVKSKVKERTGIELFCEVRHIPYEIEEG